MLKKITNYLKSIVSVQDTQEDKTKCIQCWKYFVKKEGTKIWNLCSLQCRDARYYTKEEKKINAKKYRKYKTYNCCICWKESKSIDDYRSRWESRYNKTCKSDECKRQNQRNLDNGINERKRMQWHEEETFFSKKKESYSDLLIEDKSSPTNKIYIWLAKRPLQKNDSWIWYKWVLVQSENRSLVQCNECWDWYKIISGPHLKMHWITREEYRAKYWLNKTQGLVSDVYSKFYAENIINFIKPEQMNRNPRKWLASYAKTRPKKYNTEQMKNNSWTCDLQLKAKFLDYLIGHERYPPQTKYSYQTLRRRFWSVNNALIEYWLPTRTQLWYTVMYQFADWTLVKIAKWKWYKELYELMQDKCPILNINL